MTSPLARRAGRLALAIGLTLGAFLPALAQQVEVLPREFYSERRPLEGNRIAFCINPPGLLADVERDLIAALGQSLLVEVEIVELLEGTYETPPLPLDYQLPLTEEQLFLLLAQDCDAFMGMLLSPSNPDWIMPTRPYLSAETVLVTRGDALGLDAVPFGEAIGIRISAAGDTSLINYLAARPADRTWRRIFYADNARALERLVDGTVGAVLMWEPGIYGATEGDPAGEGFAITRDLPFPVDPVNLGIATRTENAYLNGLLSDAIADLEADGTIAGLLAAHGFAPAQEGGS